MKLFEGKTPAERNKLIFAIILGVLAFASLSYMFLGSSSSSKPKTANSNTAARTQAPGELLNTRTTAPVPAPAQLRNEAETLSAPTPVNYRPIAYAVPDPGRNIFAFYVPPPPPVKPTVISTPTPVPPPPQILASMSPMNVFARTGDFTLEVSGDKFTPESAILVDNNPVPTKFISAQQLSANVPGGLINNDGARQIKVSTPDGALYSNAMPLMVTPPPLPNYLYIGIIGKVRYNDTAVLKDKGSPKELLNVQRGDVLGGRFRVTSISEREIVLTDTSLRIKHTLPFVEEKSGQSGGNTRANNPRSQMLDQGDSIPGIPNIPRYQPPAAQQQPPQDDDDAEEIPGIPMKKPQN